MSAPLHLDLLKEEERLSSSPIRIRVMLPAFAILTILGVFVWWSILIVRVHALNLQKKELTNHLASYKPAHDRLLKLRTEEQNLVATIKQLGFYKNSRITFGEALSELAEIVPEKVQLTEMRIPPPAPDPRKPVLGPTNPVEQVSLRLAGRTSGPEPVNRLFQSLSQPAFTNLIRSAEIPKGSFRQDMGRRINNRETLLFELNCECKPRRFE